MYITGRLSMVTCGTVEEEPVMCITCPASMSDVGNDSWRTRDGGNG